MISAKTRQNTVLVCKCGFQRSCANASFTQTVTAQGSLAGVPAGEHGRC